MRHPIQINCDQHVHSLFSRDGNSTIEQICQSALQKGIKYLAITDHYVFHPRLNYDPDFQYDQFSQKIEQARQKYGDQIILLKGLEVSEPHLYPEKMEKLSQYDFDVILAGIHCIDQTFISEPQLSQKYSFEELCYRYEQEILHAVQVGDFDVLAHFDLPKRYFGQMKHDFTLVEKICRVMKENHITLEINTSPLRKGIRECCPDQAVLQIYLQSGNQRLTIGSDAHHAHDIGADFNYVSQLLEQQPVLVGYFQNRQFKQI